MPGRRLTVVTDAEAGRSTGRGVDAEDAPGALSSDRPRACGPRGARRPGRPRAGWRNARPRGGPPARRERRSAPGRCSIRPASGSPRSVQNRPAAQFSGHWVANPGGNLGRETRKRR